MSNDLQGKIIDKIQSNVVPRLRLLAEEIVLQSKLDGDGKDISANLAFAVAFYTVCVLLQEGHIILVERKR